MGYTHYWKIENCSPEQFSKAVRDIQTIINYIVNVMGINLSGPYFSHDLITNVVINNEIVAFNGIDNDKNQNFIFTYQSNGCCETNHKPYDLAVICCLILFKYHLGNNMELSSDGNEEDWNKGYDIINKFFGYGLNFKSQNKEAIAIEKAMASSWNTADTHENKKHI